MPRKLNKQQQRRIELIQKEKQQRAEKREKRFADQEGQLGPEEEGLVIAHFGSQLDVEPLSAPNQRAVASDKDSDHNQANNSSTTLRCLLRANLEGLVTGDIVIFQRIQHKADTEHAEQGVVVAAQQRRSVLQRADNFGRMKTVAANIDSVFIVIAPEPEPFANLIDRYLVVCELNQLEAIIVLNKADLTDNHKAAELLQQYENLGYQTLKTSAKQHNGLQPLSEMVSNKTVVFVGQSGVGKSSLVNALNPKANAETGALSESRSKGTHTTTTARLFHLGNGGKLIDSPGIREVAMWHLNEQQVAEGFREIRPLLGQCKFRDCKHQGEPECAIAEAFEQGDISLQRMESFEFIRNSLEPDQ